MHTWTVFCQQIYSDDRNEILTDGFSSVHKVLWKNGMENVLCLHFVERYEEHCLAEEIKEIDSLELLCSENNI